MAARQRWCDQRNDLRLARMDDYGTGFLSCDRPWVLRTPRRAWHFTCTVLAGNAPDLRRNLGHSLRRTQSLNCSNVAERMSASVISGPFATRKPCPLCPLKADVQHRECHVRKVPTWLQKAVARCHGATPAALEPPASSAGQAGARKRQRRRRDGAGVTSPPSSACWHPRPARACG